MSGRDSNRALLEKEGWTRRFVACEPRLSEAVDLYRKSGFEVHLEPLPRYEECPQHDGEVKSEEECRVCFKGFEEQFSIIYTRPGTPGISS